MHLNNKEHIMTIIQTIQPDKASGKVAQVYTQLEQQFGKVYKAFQVYSASPDLLEQLTEQNIYYLQHPTLSFTLLALIRMLVSTQNDCTYCIGLNEALLIEHGGFSPEQIAATKQDPASAPINDKDKAMLSFVLKGTKDSMSIGKEDLETLHAHGWTDRDMLDGLYHGARNVSSDIMFNAFKVENDF
jgi:uncharacterized peroxidase-related enzyme